VAESLPHSIPAETLLKVAGGRYAYLKEQAGRKYTRMNANQPEGTSENSQMLLVPTSQCCRIPRSEEEASNSDYFLYLACLLSRDPGYPKHITLREVGNDSRGKEYQEQYAHCGTFYRVS
jgi:hypothetical protein